MLIYISVTLIVLAFLSACATSPLGRRQLRLFPASEVNAIIVTGRLDHARTNGIENDVAAELEKVLLGIDQNPLETTLEEMPDDYGQYLELLHERGARVFANTGMSIVTGSAEQVMAPLPSFTFVEPAPYAQIAQLLADADTVVVY